ncbi:hypothetical protein O3P69_003528 [Scylla paramamosain]|uniref:Uncharacterized protein n=1 Tax=Scylla paramamosain TaxID=85552 RepID=A0AAW0UJV2_SCYPA
MGSRCRESHKYVSVQSLEYHTEGVEGALGIPEGGRAKEGGLELRLRDTSVQSLGYHTEGDTRVQSLGYHTEGVKEPWGCLK